MGTTQASLKYMSLCVLCLQNSMNAILMRLSRIGDVDKFNSSTAVIVGEFLKLVVSITLVVQYPTVDTFEDEKFHSNRWKIIFNIPELLRISVPALMYVIQNNLLYVAASNLDASTLQVLYQLKILTTACFSVVMLRKSILPLQWGAIILLMIGVTLVQWDDSQASSNQLDPTKENGQSTTIGLFAVLAACMCSGFSGVYFEKILKNTGSKTSLWERNVQMGAISILLAVIGLLYNDREHLELNGFFYGYRPIVWAAVCMSAFGGLLTGVVVKYADNILKAFATSIAMVLTVIVSIFLFEKVPTVQFVFGAIMVNISVYIYGTAPSWTGQGGNVKGGNSLLPHITARKVAP